MQIRFLCVCICWSMFGHWHTEECCCYFLSSSSSSLLLFLKIIILFEQIADIWKQSRIGITSTCFLFHVSFCNNKNVDKKETPESKKENERHDQQLDWLHWWTRKTEWKTVKQERKKIRTQNDAFFSLDETRKKTYGHKCEQNKLSDIYIYILLFPPSFPLVPFASFLLLLLLSLWV